MKVRKTVKLILFVAIAIIPVATGRKNGIGNRNPLNKLQRNLSKRKTPHSAAAAATATTAAVRDDKKQPDASVKKSSAAMEGFKNSIASGLASCCAKTLLQPFDTIKTMQQHYKGDDNSNTALTMLEAATLVMDRGNGFWELYAGLAVSALGSVPAIGLYYGVYSYCKRILIPFFQENYGSAKENNNNNSESTPKRSHSLSDEHLKWLAVALSAALGNTFASVARVPYEVVKQKVQTGVYENTWMAITTMFQNGGLTAFFPMGGVSIQMIRDIPYAILTLVAYEILRDNWVNQNPSPFRDLVAGATAGGFGSYTTNGLDVIKTRLQTSPELYGGSVLECMRITWQEGGVRSFMRGSVPRLLHKIPANGSFFVFYEFFRRLLRVEGSSKGKQ